MIQSFLSEMLLYSYIFGQNDLKRLNLPVNTGSNWNI